MASFTKEQALNNLKGLIRRYNENVQDNEYTKNEQRICDNLIIPFFKLVLGWNPETEFISQSVQGGKRVDYLVVLDSISQFVIEAKSLSHDIKGHHQYYQQAIQYAQYKEKKFAILTNFKNFVVLDAEIETEPLKAEVAAIDIEKLDGQFDILWTFSKEVWKEKGESNEILLKLKGKKKQKIDIQLLDDLKKWRMLLLNNLKKYTAKNKYDFEKDINYIEEEVQKFIDRLVFICYCEDKQLMDVELKPIISDKEDDKNWDKPNYIIDRIRKLFDVYNNKYNSDLFVKGWCDDFYFDDHSLIQVLKDLRQPKLKLPYDFSIIEADILGKTYENFIGHVLAVKKRIKEKESKGKRKEMGIYYTPTYIVDYIVRNTVGEYIKGKSFASMLKIKILDPACGSGSFLIKAFDVLVDEAKRIKGVKELSYEDKEAIILNCIHGVDKDERAVDICKLNLSLKLAERGKKLPELHGNIKCGDSLIDDSNIAGDKAFNWNEKFKSIMDNGGFDVVIGNPPWGAELDKQELMYLRQSYDEIIVRMIDTFMYFIYRSSKLLKMGGFFGMIIPDTLLYQNDNEKLREYILKNFCILNVINLGGNVFEHVNRPSSIIVFNKEKNDSNIVKVADLSHLKEKFNAINDNKLYISLNQNKIMSLPNKLFLTQGAGDFDILDKIKSLKPVQLKYLVDSDGIQRGVSPDFKDAFIIDLKTANNHKLEKIKLKPVLTGGKQVKRYSIKYDKLYLIYTKREDNPKKIPNIVSYINTFKDKITCTEVKEKKHPIYALHRPRDEKIFDKKIKILGVITEDEIVVAPDFFGTYVTDGLYLFSLNDTTILQYVLGILNSSLFKFLYQLICMEKGRVLAQVKPTTLEKFPIVMIDKEHRTYVGIKILVDKMLSLNKKLQEIGDKSTMEKEKIQEEIMKTDNEIDELVYQLYEITKEEKKIIEESLK